MVTNRMDFALSKLLQQLLRISNFAHNALAHYIWSSQAFSFGKNTAIHHSCRISGIGCLSIGSNVSIGINGSLYCDAGGECPKIIIEDGACLNHGATIFAKKKITIRKNIVFAPNVYIADHSHEYRNIQMPIKYQGSTDVSEVEIGENCWIGINACILPGCKIGRNCVIGANSVVTRSFPSYCVIAGAPAQLIKKYNEQKKCWESAKSE